MWLSGTSSWQGVQCRFPKSAKLTMSTMWHDDKGCPWGKRRWVPSRAKSGFSGQGILSTEPSLLSTFWKRVTAHLLWLLAVFKMSCCVLALRRRHFAFHTGLILGASYLYLKDRNYYTYSEGLNYVDWDKKGSSIDFIVWYLHRWHMAAPYRLLLSTVFLLRPLKETMIEKTEIFRCITTFLPKEKKRFVTCNWRWLLQSF